MKSTLCSDADLCSGINKTEPRDCFIVQLIILVLISTHSQTLASVGHCDFHRGYFYYLSVCRRSVATV